MILKWNKLVKVNKPWYETQWFGNKLGYKNKPWYIRSSIKSCLNFCRKPGYENKPVYGNNPWCKILLNFFSD